MQEYYLFLDESKPNTNFRYFTLGGVILEKTRYEEETIPLVNGIKTECFENDEVILHEVDIRSKKGVFAGITKEIQEKFFKELGRMFDIPGLLKVIAVSADLDEFEKLYCADDINNIYYIALQLLMENFTQFLTVHEGIGTVYLETTDAVNNTRLQNLFHMLKANGTLYFKKETLQKRLSTINFSIKSENNIGLQLADFVPNPLTRYALGKKQKPFSILESIQKNLYDGNVGRTSRFGHKIMK